MKLGEIIDEQHEYFNKELEKKKKDSYSSSIQ